MPLVPLRDIVWDAYTLTLTSASYDDVNLPEDYNLFHVSTFSGTTITGFNAAARYGRPVWVSCTAAAGATIKHQDTSSEAQNRVICPNGQDIRISGSEFVGMIYSEQDERWLAFPGNPRTSTSGTSFPSSPYNGQSFYRTDLYEEFRYDSSSGLWVGQRAVTVAMGYSGTISATDFLDGVDGVAHGGTDRGWYFSENMRLLHVEATWQNSASFDIQLRRDNVSFRTISPSATTEIAAKDVFDDFAAGGVYTIRIIIGQSQPANMQVHSTFCRVIAAGQGQ